MLGTGCIRLAVADDKGDFGYDAGKERWYRLSHTLSLQHRVVDVIRTKRSVQDVPIIHCVAFRELLQMADS